MSTAQAQYAQYDQYSRYIQYAHQYPDLYPDPGFPGADPGSDPGPGSGSGPGAGMGSARGSAHGAGPGSAHDPGHAARSSPYGPPTLFPSESDSSRLSPRELGREGERIAAEYLRVAGYRVLDRNWRWRGPDVRGELDIVAIAGDVLVPVEVKTRRALPGGGGGPGFGGVGRPLDAVTDAKRTRLWRLANRWLAEHRHDPDFRRNCPGSVRGVRLDVIGLLFPADGRTEPLLDHLQAV